MFAADLDTVPFASSAIVHTVHGWATAFVGFRFLANCWLHMLNFLYNLMMRLQHPSNLAEMGLWGVISNNVKLLGCNAVLPILLNVLHEFRQRAKYVEATGSSEAIKPFWALLAAAMIGFMTTKMYSSRKHLSSLADEVLAKGPWVAST